MLAITLTGFSGESQWPTIHLYTSKAKKQTTVEVFPINKIRQATQIIRMNKKDSLTQRLKTFEIHSSHSPNILDSSIRSCRARGVGNVGFNYSAKYVGLTRGHHKTRKLLNSHNVVRLHYISLVWCVEHLHFGVGCRYDTGNPLEESARLFLWE